MCAALANVEEDNWSGTTFDTVKGGELLVDQDRGEVMCRRGGRRGARPGEDGAAFNRTAEAKIEPALLR